MANLILSRAEYLVVLDILGANHIFGLDNQTLFPADREVHLDLIHQGIRQLEARQLVRIDRGRHIIERRLLELGAVVAKPQVAIMTVRDRAGIGQQLYLHYQSQKGVVEQTLPEKNIYSLGQLPDIASALDRIVRLLELPVDERTFPDPQAIDRTNLLTAQSRLEAGDWDAALADLSRSGLPEPWSSSFLATLADRRSAGLVNLLALHDNQPDESRDLTLMQGVDMTWLVTSQSSDHNRLLVRQINAASFRQILDAAYETIAQFAQELL